MKKIINKIYKTSLIIFSSLVSLSIILLVYFNWPVAEKSEKAELGITFSARYAKDIQLDPRETLEALLDELGIRSFRIPVYWDQVEKESGQYDFSEIDWQIEAIGKRKGNVILVVGQKVPRWPECFVPEWASRDSAIRKKGALNLIQKTVDRYKDNPHIKYWQIENEPFLPFGVCPPFEKNFLDEEIRLVRTLDPRPIIVTDSGELSLWFLAARRADIFGTTLYRSVVSDKLNISFDYPIGPNFFKFKKMLVKIFAGEKEIIVVELQGEPWLKGWTTDRPLFEQLESMNAHKLEDNVIFAEKAGFKRIYLWGGEWWYWLKIKRGEESLWQAAQKIFAERHDIMEKNYADEK